MNPERLPFKEPLKETDKSGNFMSLKEFEGNSRYIVKESKESVHDSRFKRTTEDELRTLRAEKRDYDKLKSIYTDHLPEALFILGEREEGKKRFFIVQEKIVGDPLSQEMIENNPEARKQLYNLVNTALDYYIDSLRELNAEYPYGNLVDLKEDNFIFGHKENEQDRKLYFIDTISVFLNPGPTEAVSSAKEFMEKLGIDPAEFQQKLDEIENLEKIEDSNKDN